MKNKKIDLMSTQNLVDLFLKEEQGTINTLKKQKSNITKAINKVIEKIKKSKNTRVIYVGSGTSGRLGFLDASECKPTFNTNIFKAIIAGGKNAVFQAKEGEEDKTKQAIKDLKKIKITKDDVVIGISASGETPYTVSALKHAKKCRSTTIAITSNSKSILSRIAHFKISPEITKEIIVGSSRLKSGTAQKIILNMISSITMIKSGKVYDDLMIDVQPTNRKLINRAIGIISIVCKVSLNKAQSLFFKARKNTKAAIVMYFKKCSLNDALKLFSKSKFNLRRVIP